MDKLLRKITIIFFMLCFKQCVVIAGNNEELFLRGNNYYNNKMYEKALEAYREIPSKGRAVLYNMGNCFYHTHDYVQALVYWSKAERDASYTERRIITCNKELALKKLDKLPASTQTQKIYKTITEYSHHIPLLFLQFFFLLLWYFFIMTTYKKRRSLFAKYSILLCTLLLGIILYERHNEDAMHACITIEKKSSIYRGPDENFHVITTIPSAEFATILDQKEGWYKIQYSDTVGWIKADSVQTI